jgi:hypothetical protein
MRDTDAVGVTIIETRGALSKATLSMRRRFRALALPVARLLASRHQW